MLFDPCFMISHAIHSSLTAIELSDALPAVRELFYIAYWFARTYARASRLAPGLTFDPAQLLQPTQMARQTAEQLQAFESRLRAEIAEKSRWIRIKRSLF
jgi:type I restriction enzyme, R subunit